ncbi:MAG: protein kinase domain-containing protein, partial [Chthoniobacterales bacterium]
VSLAEDTALGRKVAIKVVKRGVGTSTIIRHFHHEERILAGLTHPNIARLYGGGVTAQGSPYFVMEYVEGERLDEYCDLRALSIVERLQLFRKVCSAVAYAHQHLVIHRDIKPANIRINPEGEPKLLDFGIAKLLDDDTQLATGNTMTLLGVMTPDYASPEQVRGETMTTASDTYSLGVLLYELLTGRKPFLVTSHQPDKILRTITEVAPTKPSTVVRESPKSKIQNPKLLRGDLDNIVLMALRKEPERRYASVGQFAEDIRRHLEGLPVIARKDTAGYRASKFIRRNKVGAIAALLVLLTLIGGIVATSREARVARRERSKAERRFNDVRKLANSYLFELHDAIEKLPGSTPARELLVKRALEYLESLSREAQHDASLQREVALAYLKVGNVQGNPNGANLGDTAGALVSYRKALAVALPLAAADPKTQQPLALIHEKMADGLAASGDTGSALEQARASLAIREKLATDAPNDVEARQALAVSHLKTGDIRGNPNFKNAGDRSGAMQSYRDSLGILQALSATAPSNARTRRLLALIYERIGTMFQDEKVFDQASDSFRKSLSIRESLASDSPNDTDAVRDAAIAHEKIGNVAAATGQLDSALESRAKSLQILQHLVEADPKNAQAQQSLAISHLHMGDLLGGADTPNLGRSTEALEHYQTAISLLNPIKGEANARTRDTAAEIERKIAKLTVP